MSGTDSRSDRDVVVVGAGVIGLTSAVALLEAGFKVSVVAQKTAPDITSSVAAGLWYPYAVGGDRVPKLAVETLRWYQSIHADPTTGVRLVECQSIVPEAARNPYWSDERVHFERTRDGLRAVLPVAEPALFLPFLVDRIRFLGGSIRIVSEAVGKVAELETPVIVNCTGLGARALCGDERVYPIRGTVVLVENPGIDYCLTDDVDPTTPTYIIPTSAGLVLGGTAEANEWDVEIDAAKLADIRSRCAKLAPRVAHARVLAVKTGFRPARDEVRLEREELDDGRIVVHNYGHGGAGFTLAWGCAQAVVEMVE